MKTASDLLGSETNLVEADLYPAIKFVVVKGFAPSKVPHKHI